MITVSKEIIQLKRKNLLLLEKELIKGNQPNNDINQSFSGYSIISNYDNFVWKWLPKEFIDKYNIDLKGDQNLSLIDFTKKYLHPFSIIPYAPKIIKARILKSEQIFEIMEYARPNDNKNYEWWHKTTKFSKQNNCILSIVHSVDKYHKPMFGYKSIFSNKTFLQQCEKDNQNLTKRQQQVLRLLALGFTNKEIANEINISPNTVRTYRNQIHKVLDLRWKNINHSQFYYKYASAFGLIS